MHVRFTDALPGEGTVAFTVAKGALASGTPGPDATAQTLLRASASAAKFEGDAGSVVEAFVPQGNGAQRMFLVGTGTGSATDWERAGAALVGRLLTSGETGVAVDVAGSEDWQAAAFGAGALQRAWRHDAYRTRHVEKHAITLQDVVLANAPPGAVAIWPNYEALAEGVALTRTLVSEPPNILFPEAFVERCEHLSGLGVTVRVLGEAEMRAEGMGALLGVSQGSAREAQLLVLYWNGTDDGDADPDLALVGKGVTFDTGGISIKPAAGMEDMKWDMGGAAAVAGAIKSLAMRRAKANVVGICGLVENMPDGAAQRPSDVVTSMSGQTIEVLNTDAEGRLVLCDAITWVQKHYRPRTIVDLATLTGAMVISLGSEHAGIFSNDDDLAGELIAAGIATGDLLWRFPLADAYDKLIDSPIADMKNVGPRGAGSITAAQFIKRFVDDGVRWAHLDIAGVVWADKPGATWDKGATGYGVRLLDRFVAEQFEHE